jgi:hypothetical protein
MSSKSWRVVWKDQSDSSKVQAPVIFCIWHKHLALGLASYDNYAKKKWNEKGLAALVSASGDGAFLAAILGKFNIETARGSSSRRGPQALLEASRWLRNGYSLAITPDGPRGPAQKIQDGVLYLAQVTGCAIIPVSNYAHWKIRLKSWDRFQIPLPFTKCEFVVGNPIFVGREATEADRDKIRAQLESALDTIARD